MPADDIRVSVERLYEACIRSREEWHRDLSLDHPEDILAYTDGSKEDGFAGYGVAIKNRLEDVWWASAPLWSEPLCIKSGCIRSRILLDGHDNLHRLALNNKLVLKWIPGHAGHSGNELADELARKHTRGNNVPRGHGPEPIIPIAYAVVREHVNKGLVKRHQEMWRNSTIKYKLIPGPLQGTGQW
ncbi:unnamed protein product [Allacma fusca]|uniref:RNase H type-1 domain-containing protein n=1 Tax=Allacma fusca TaxID=39272 RepID=A0A8J2NMZ0_9HEXA|nr:unnamed protein product [Allacma fusca]